MARARSSLASALVALACLCFALHARQAPPTFVSPPLAVGLRGSAHEAAQVAYTAALSAAAAPELARAVDDDDDSSFDIRILAVLAPPL
eukprot:CAMPEP_0117508804 /NCGR_PEP_ID=MMETSP0784-20121206/27139_1 /TAXON_ID=39447 /ORGANISM="" /LENGTH=88 /DNA_ID=CAMNT_0005304373 /DNA_START=8 /DNA_END=271 /DNA_ORIENTATION=+